MRGRRGWRGMGGEEERGRGHTSFNGHFDFLLAFSQEEGFGSVDERTKALARPWIKTRRSNPLMKLCVKTSI